MIVFEIGLLAVGILLVLFPKLGAPSHHHGVLLGAAAGILFGVSDVAIKALTGSVAENGLVAGLASPWLLTCLAASVIAFFASARGLQQGEAVPVITHHERRRQRHGHRRRHHRVRRSAARRHARDRHPDVRLRARDRGRRAHSGAASRGRPAPAR